MRTLWALRTLLALTAVAAVTGLAGCGSGAGSTAGSGSSPSASVASAGASTSAASPAGSSTGADSSTGSGRGGDAARFCALARQQVSSLAGEDLTKLVTAGTPSSWRAYFAAKAKQNAALLAAAPPSIRPTLDAVSAATEKLRAALDKADYDFAKVPLAEFTKAVRTPEFAAAAKALGSYLASTCQLTLPGT